jgi:hypothetical protein
MARVKWRPTYSLAEIKAQMTTIESMHPTRTAVAGVYAAEMSLKDALAVIQALRVTQHFRKSMPCDHDHTVWQDVYYSDWGGLPLYVKFQRAGVYFVVSFKERDVE